MLAFRQAFVVFAALLELTMPATASVGLPQPVQPLTAPAGATAVSGRIVGQDGGALSGIKVSDNSAVSRTDGTGRFLIVPIPPGKSVLRIDARRGGPRHNIDYGVYELRVAADPGRTAILSDIVWLTPLDHTHDVAITSPTKSEVVVQNPAIPNLEIHIPPGVVIRDADGKAATWIGITLMPSDKTPLQMPRGAVDPVFFTIQPGGGCLYDAHGGIGTAQVRYPNFRNELPGARAILWRYEPDRRGWAGYGTGIVSSDGKQVIPDKGALITDFDSAECDPLTMSHAGTPVRLDPWRITP